MKKFLSVILIAVMMLSMAACSTSNEETTTQGPEQTTESTTLAPEQTTEGATEGSTSEEATTEATTESTTEEATTEATTKEEATTEATTEEVTTGEDLQVALDPLSILVNAWNDHGDDEKFAVMGGDFNTMVSDAPGAFGIEDTESLDSMLALPADSAALIDSAASLIHMMNANTFTCGAFRAVNADDAAAIAQALHDNIAARQWMCGFPDKMVIMTIDNCIVSMFGNEMAVDNFKAHVAACYDMAEVAFDEAIA